MTASWQTSGATRQNGYGTFAASSLRILNGGENGVKRNYLAAYLNHPGREVLVQLLARRCNLPLGPLLIAEICADAWHEGRTDRQNLYSVLNRCDEDSWEIIVNSHWREVREIVDLTRDLPRERTPDACRRRRAWHGRGEPVPRDSPFAVSLSGSKREEVLEKRHGHGKWHHRRPASGRQ